MIIYFIGFRGAGKSTLAKAMTEKMKSKAAQFLDCDEIFESRNGMRILEWIEKHGETSFREKECEVLKSLPALCKNTAEKKIHFIATGGGFVDFPKSYAFLAQQSSPRIFIDCSAQQLWERLKTSPDRLKVGNITDFSGFQALYNARLPKYKSLATHTLVSGGTGVHEDIRKIEAFFDFDKH